MNEMSIEPVLSSILQAGTNQPGATGPRGATGPQGSQGLMGLQGPTGPIQETTDTTITFDFGHIFGSASGTVHLSKVGKIVVLRLEKMGSSVSFNPPGVIPFGTIITSNFIPDDCRPPTDIIGYIKADINEIGTQIIYKVSSFGLIVFYKNANSGLFATSDSLQIKNIDLVITYMTA